MRVLPVPLFFALALTSSSPAMAQTAPPQSIVPGNCTPATQFYAQRIDHANAATNNANATFQQQYQIIDTYFRPGGPIFFNQQGETEKMICLVRRLSLPNQRLLPFQLARQRCCTLLATVQD